MTRFCAPWSCGLWILLGFGAREVQAGNGGHPRTPVLFPEEPAILILNRSQAHGAEIFVRYQIPYEDTDVTVDEVENSRTQQFFALAKQPLTVSELPNWITLQDVQAAAAKNLVEPQDVLPEHVLEESPVWKSAFERITADDQRRPITFEQANKGVVWNVESVPDGVYGVYGYTWEPLDNLWRARLGVIKLVQDESEASDLPALALVDKSVILAADESTILHGCVSASPGSTVTAHYAKLSQGALEWISFVEDQPVEDGPLQLAFGPVPDLSGESVYVRAELRDSQDRAYLAYLPDAVTILENSQGGCEDTGGFLDMGCETSAAATTGPLEPEVPCIAMLDGVGDWTTGAAETAGSGSTDVSAPPEQTSGCGCLSTGEPARIFSWMGLAAIGWIFVRSRRSSPLQFGEKHV